MTEETPDNLVPFKLVADVINQAPNANDDPLTQQAVMAASAKRKPVGAGQPSSLQGVGGGEDENINSGLPDDCPVIPLGKTGVDCHYLDGNQQLISIKAREHSRLSIIGLFGPGAALIDGCWPRFGKEGDRNGCDYDAAAKDLMASCAKQGIWNPLEKVRGPGAWCGDRGELILHCGDAILVEGAEHKPGKVGRHVYPGAEPVPRPEVFNVPAGENGPGKTLLALIQTWQWARPHIDPLILLGWVGAAMLGGALAWRPATWITGGQGTGKSTLHSVLKDIFGGALVSVSDATPAGIWQKLGHATLPVMIDELEAEADNRRAEGIIKLARQAASGGVILRGGQDHIGSEFMARSCFLFSSILIPPLEPQDMWTRTALVESAFC